MIVSTKVKPKEEKPPPAANVPKVVKEEDLNVVILTSEAEKRIGLTLGKIVEHEKQRMQGYGGEAMIPVGKVILVSAPLSGVLKAPDKGMITVGQLVNVGDPIFQLEPLLTPDSKATLAAALTDAEGQVNNAKTQLDLSKIALERARKVLMDGAGSQRQVDEAQAAFDLATKTLEAVNARANTLKQVLVDAKTGTTSPIAITAPQSGMLRAMTASPGQSVPSGAGLFEIVDLSTLWVRVSIPVGDLDLLDKTASAQLASDGVKVKPVVAPPSANQLASTVDVYYEYLNPTRKMTPGERLNINIPMKQSAKPLMVPWSAIVMDIYGGTWVYERASEHRYVRRRVTVQYSNGNDAILESGPQAGTPVVTAGVMQLFASETGFVK
jgi:RND family efflux transporter MFP subunit